jgi:hypothetical protein
MPNDLVRMEEGNDETNKKNDPDRQHPEAFQSQFPFQDLDDLINRAPLLFQKHAS